MSAFPEAVIYDMDGIIIDSESIWLDVFNDFFARHDKAGEYTTEVQAEFMGTSREYWGKRVKEILDLGEDWTAERTAQVNIDEVHHRMKQRTDLMEGFLESIQRIQGHGIRIGLASGNSQEVIDYVIEHKELGGMFEVALSSTGQGEPKPAPDVYLSVLQHMGVDPRLAVGIEDSPNGVLSVKAAEMKCIAVPTPLLTDHHAFTTADVVLGSLAELHDDHLKIG